MKRIVQLGLAAVLVAALLPEPSSAQDEGGIFGGRVASVTYGPYARLEYGSAKTILGDAFWLPPGESDPRITFDTTALDEHVEFGSAALGYDWQNGIRAEMAFFGTGTTDLTAPCKAASNGTPCSAHADITSASVRTAGVMGNVYFAPLEARGSNAIFQPFVVAGVGLSRNTVGEWTRTKNSDNPTFTNSTERIFTGGTSTNFAWSAGVGAALQVTRPGRWPVIVEATWRYYDLGTASGGAQPVISGRPPRKPMTFDIDEQVITLGIRIPLRRY